MKESSCNSLELKVAVLENVIGLRKVMPEVLQELAECGDYMIEVLQVDPNPGNKALCLASLSAPRKDYGVCCTRNRFYIVMILRDYLTKEANLQATVDSLKTSKSIPWPHSQAFC